MKETDRFLRDLLSKGLIYEKIVSKCTPTSGAVYLHKSLIGRRFRVILIPIDSDIDLNKGYIKVESEKYNNMKDELARLKQTIKTLPEKKETSEATYPPGHNWEGLTPSQVNEGYKDYKEREGKKGLVHIDTEAKEETNEEPLS